MMPCMMDQNASTSQAGPDCARFWLQKAIELHDLHMKDPSTTTNESNMELMDQMERAYECDTGKNVTENISMGVMDRNTTMGMMDQNTNTAQTREDCASFLLKKAIKLHDLHMKDPKAAANESSQMELMNQLILAYDCIPANEMNMGMNQNAGIAQARLHCADFWLKEAIELHDVHLKDPSTATEESQEEMMYQMMRAHECVKGEIMAKGMTNIERSVSGGH